MTNILVTGSAGFIASHIIEKLLEDKNNNIFGLDNFSTGTKSTLAYIHSIDKSNKFTFFESDIRDFEKINSIIKENSISQIYHLAAIASVQVSIDNPILTNEVNLKGTLNILEASRKNKVKRVVFSSSAAVYGNEPSLPKNESSLTCPISPYGYEKLMSEKYMKLYSDLYNIETVVLRYFNVYGERQSCSSDYSGVISIFEEKFKKNIIPVIYGDGEQYRDFIYVKDVANINLKAMNTPDISGEIFCVGTAQKISINAIFEELNNKYNKSLVAEYKEARSGDIVKSISNNNLLIDTFKIDNFVSFKEGILRL